MKSLTTTLIPFNIINSLHAVEPSNPEWNILWKKLSEHSINKGFIQPTIVENFGEVWQYMYTEECKFLYFGKRLCHVFRHRYHPKTNKQEYLEIPVSKVFLKNCS